MKHLLWAVIVVSLATATSVLADETDDASLLSDASIEVGFSQDGEPEPHMLAVASAGEVRVYQVREREKEPGRRSLASATPAPAEIEGRELSKEVFLKRLRQAVDDHGFFNARQVREKRRCHDSYILRVKVGKRFRERRGCSIQGNDPFAAFSQNFFRDAFLAWKRK
jgi:hypothetical protein